VDVNQDGHLDLLVAFAGLLMCIDGPSRNQLWNHTYGFTMIDTFFVEDVNNDSMLEVVAVHSNVTYCYRAVDGFQLWNYTSTHTLADAGCVCDTDADGDLEIVVGSAATADPHVYCIDGNTGTQIWNFTTTGLIAPSPTAADLNHDGQLEIVFGSWDNSVYCLNASDGTQLWRYTGIYRPSGYSPTIADIDLDGDYEVFVGAYDNYVHCLNGVNGTREWRFRTDDYALSSATVVDIDNDGAFEAIVPSRDGNVYCLNASGDLVWTYHTNDNIHCGASVADIDMDHQLEIIVSSRDDYLHCIDGDSGLAEWTYYLGDYGWGIPTVVDFDGDGVLEMIVTVGWSGVESRIFCLSLATAPEPNFYPWPGIAPLGDPTHKCRYIDTDMDFLVDEYEIAAGSDVSSSDPDTDLLSDYQEYLQGSDPMVDSVPPGAIDDLVISGVTTTSLTLNWDAPGENGEVGTVSSYVVKWSSSGPITEENWDSATTYSQSWTPLAPGNPESHEVTGLPGDQPYWFAVRALDEDGNIGGISNSPETTFDESIPPGTISDLAVVNTTTTSVSLNWTAPGDDGFSGSASGYDVRFSATGPISEVNWTSAETYSQTWTPVPAGSAETRTLTGLDSLTTYWFAIKAYDDVDNYGAVSNSPEAQTKEADAPQSIDDLSYSGILPTSVTITWTAPGDDGDIGLASGYILKYSTTGPITSENWENATTYIQSWTPSSPGTVESETVAGLTPDTSYWFAIVAFDEVPNYGGLSNVLSLTTPEGIPPDSVTDLAVVGQNSTSIILSCTAPGDDGSSGHASYYVVKYSSEGPITAQNWDDVASSVRFENPLAAGETEMLTIGGLQANTSYWFAIVAFDDVPNPSALSNIAYGSTSPIGAAAAPLFETGLLIGIGVGAAVVIVSIVVVTIVKKRRP
jgi:outer membrane protein assembly factor BamB